MKTENYINVVTDLNNDIMDNCEKLYNKGMAFEYSSTGFSDAIFFGGYCIYCSESDKSVETEEELETVIREKLLVITNLLCKWQHYDGFEE